MYFIDIEADGLLDSVTKIHCLAKCDTKDEEPELIVGHDNVISWWANTGHKLPLCAHNAIQYDIPVLEKFSGVEYSGPKIADTLIMSRLFNSDRPGGHGLDMWGRRVGLRKEEIETDWKEYTPAMGHYCQVDVRVLRRVYRRLLLEAKGHDWSESYKLECAFAKVMLQQELNGWYFDLKKAKALVKTLSKRVEEIDKRLVPLLPKRIVDAGELKALFKKDGTPTANLKKWMGEKASAVCGPFSRIEAVDYDLGSRTQVKELISRHFGWIPEEYTDKGNPRLTEESLQQLEGDLGKLFYDRFVCVTRKTTVTNWIEATREDGRIVSGGVPCGTPTGRVRHTVVVNVPRPTTAWGPELRSLFTVPKGRVLVGCDLSGIELRKLAHYVGVPAIVKEILDGDIHQRVATRVGVDRNCAKTLEYGWLYGAGDDKLERIALEHGKKKLKGKDIRKALLEALSAEQLIKKCKSKAKRGYLVGLDGRKLHIRHDHAALNSLLQGAGAVAFKVWAVYSMYLVEKYKLDAKLVGSFHDELNFDCAKKDVDKLKELLYVSLKKTEKRLGIKVRLDCEAKVGSTWMDVH